MPRERRHATSDLVAAYVAAKREVIEAGYVDEIAWQRDVRLFNVDPTTFTREAAWVILSAGMSTVAVERRFPQLATVLHQWNPQSMMEDQLARGKALALFAHPGKIGAIWFAATTAAALGARGLLHALQDDPRAFLTTLPYIGPVTWAHLAKNLGVPTAKADRHLERLSRACQRSSPQDLCGEIGSWLDEPTPVVDVVLWRYATLHATRCKHHGCQGIPHPLSS